MISRFTGKMINDDIHPLLSISLLAVSTEISASITHITYSTVINEVMSLQCDFVSIVFHYWQTMLDLPRRRRPTVCKKRERHTNKLVQNRLRVAFQTPINTFFYVPGGSFFLQITRQNWLLFAQNITHSVSTLSLNGDFIGGAKTEIHSCSSFFCSPSTLLIIKIDIYKKKVYMIFHPLLPHGEHNIFYSLLFSAPLASDVNW